MQHRAGADATGAVLKVWRQTNNPTPPIDAYSLQEQSFNFHPEPVLNRGFMEEVAINKNRRLSFLTGAFEK